ncbi:MAG: hypothetical protein QXW47_05945 [Candidatus Jordarchaeales archaeon]|nr:hypothetical protein [Candidatus Jordarchaeia archaeon]
MTENFFRVLSRYGAYGVLILVLLSALLGSVVAAALKKAGFLTPLAALAIILITTLSLGGFTALLYLKYIKEAGC